MHHCKLGFRTLVILCSINVDAPSQRRDELLMRFIEPYRAIIARDPMAGRGLRPIEAPEMRSPVFFASDERWLRQL